MTYPKKLRGIFYGMKKRCYNPNATRFCDYGGRGITVCPEWMEDSDNFYIWALTHGYKEGLSIERKDVNGNYSPENCEWIPMSLQAKNQRSNNKITIDGVTKNLSDWSEEYGISRTTLSSRYFKLGLRGKDLLQPVKKPKKAALTFEYEGEILTLKQIAEKVGLQKKSIYKHIRLGKSLEEAILTVKGNLKK